MPINERIKNLSGVRQVEHVRGSPIEHRPHMEGNPVLQHGRMEEAAEKEREIVGLPRRKY